MLSVNRSTIYRWAKQGKLNIVYLNRLPRISEEEIERIKEDGNEKRKEDC